MQAQAQGGGGAADLARDGVDAVHEVLGAASDVLAQLSEGLARRVEGGAASAGQLLHGRRQDLAERSGFMDEELLDVLEEEQELLAQEPTQEPTFEQSNSAMDEDNDEDDEDEDEDEEDEDEEDEDSGDDDAFAPPKDASDEARDADTFVAAFRKYEEAVSVLRPLAEQLDAHKTAVASGQSAPAHSEPASAEDLEELARLRKEAQAKNARLKLLVDRLRLLQQQLASLSISS
ncbi:Hypothetical Protein FCC1311_042492 [Hondaea fermentalgiana]|uniref:Uncharacterized protein n=1 Tax=Hondaea fermentalgiana TaxID=2315210 RepID=A0A2R5GAG7_9STRA|nr:Hypothetical Protein FCC1311_042492 [Hondaea fermentalgiana]|eukprot:GBG28026.1 Hypothetical Protein FCC1311_042492 [Hondaea fermentalgiana]